MDFKQISNIYTTESLCFTKDEFIKENFNPDTFIKVFQATCPEGLDRLRDDLGIYLKILRSAMIDLINRDYADFVNLSTNLTGFDLVIDALKTPLGQLQEEVMSVDHLMSDAIVSIENDLEKRHHINEEKVILHKLSLISMRLEHLETLLKSERDKNTSGVVNNEDYIEDELVNRVAIEVNQLNFLVSECGGASLLDTLMPRVNSICLFVEKGLEKSLNEGIKGNKALLVRTLRTYANLGTIEHAYQQAKYLIRESLIPVISDSVMKSHPKGLRGVYEKAIMTVQQITDPLLSALAEGKQDNTCEFSFLENSAFPEIVDAIIERLPSIFNPAIPTSFHQKYSESMRFIEKFEGFIGSYDKLVKFRSQIHYKKFMDQWNLAVYFQIRYQEIGLVVEASLSCEAGGLREAHISSDFLLASSQAVFDGVQKCFRPESFLLALLHRFWKLFLLILARHRTFIEDKINLLKKNSKMEAVRLQKLDDTSIESSLTNLKIDGKRVVGGIEAAIFIFNDINVFKSKLETFYQDFILIHVSHMTEEMKTIMKGSIRNQIESLVMLKSKLLEVVTEICTIAASSPLRLVGDTPRLYRRTNKTMPQVHQSYVENCVKPLQIFVEMSNKRLPLDDVRLAIETVFASTFTQYYKHTYEVLNSVHKMEESLKKLKRARDRGTQQTVDSSSGPTDDDKIRMQIYLDVKFLQEKLSSLDIDASHISAFTPLLDMVTQAKEGTFTLK